MKINLKNHQIYYLKNKIYSKFLSQSGISTFQVYIEAILKYRGQKKKFLDVGCGTGIVVDHLTKQGVNATGVEISQSSLEYANKMKGKYFQYDGGRLPFKNESFDIVGSFDVVEHVSDLEIFLIESVRVLKRKGILIICTPNFLSVTNSYHSRTSGLQRKSLNILILFKKYLLYILFKKYRFEYFEPIVRKKFQPDDDAIVLTNGIDLTAWGLHNKLSLLESRGSILSDYGLKRILTRMPIVMYFFGGVYLVFRKR